MKKISFLSILIFIAGIMFSCNSSSSSSNTVTGYIDPGLTTAKTVNAYKAYTLSNTYFGTCAAPTACLAIIYQGTLGSTPYVGIAVKNGDHTLKMYWEASSIETGTGLTILNCTVNLDGTVTNGVTISVDITDNNLINLINGTYIIKFNSPIDSSLINIVEGDSITAVKI